MTNSILFALLAGTFLRNFNSQYSVLIVITVALFAVLDFGARGEDNRWRNLAQLTLVLFAIFLVTVGPLLLEIYLRQITAPYEHIHDGALQAEEALKFLLAGQNPYGADYSQTPLVLWLKDYGNYPNPALRYYAYLPLTFLLPLPFYAIAQATLGWFDIRFVFLLCFGILLFLLPRLVETWERRFGLLIAFGLNPLFVPFFVEGRNDVLILTAVVCSIFFLQRRKIGAAAFVLGLACAAKQTAWFVVPFFLAESFFILSNWRAWVRRAVLPIAIPFAIVLVPFVLWDAWVLVDNTLIYASIFFPIAGYGFGQLLLLCGIVPNAFAPFPSVWLEILVGAPTLFFLLRYQQAHPTWRVLSGASAVLTFAVAFFNRVFQDNYIGYVIALAVLAYFLPGEVRDA